MQHYNSRQELLCVGGWLYHYYKCPLLYNYYGASIKRITRSNYNIRFFLPLRRDFFALKIHNKLIFIYRLFVIIHSLVIRPS